MIRPADIFQTGVLIVDDQEANVALLEKTLRGAGYVSVTTTKDPREVCELHRQHRYSLILLDLQMPNLDGFEVMKGLQAIETDGYLPVLVITAQPGHKLRALKAGARDFVSKPFDLSEVLMRVYNMIEVRLLHLETTKLCHQLRIANEELQSFSYSVSHDLRAPLRHILGFLALLKKEAGASLSEKSVNYMTTISEAGKKDGEINR